MRFSTSQGNSTTSAAIGRDACSGYRLCRAELAGEYGFKDVERGQRLATLEALEAEKDYNSHCFISLLLEVSDLTSSCR